MAFFLRMLWRSARGRPPNLVCRPATWKAGVDELRRRAADVRESGAFLLGTPKGGRTRRIEQFLFYDDVDPNCFAHGFVEFDGRRLGAVWSVCRESGRTVLADIHVHPGGCSQSSSDRHNPMIAEAGHVAIILPYYAAGPHLPPAIGIYEYLGGRRWRDHSALGDRILHIGWWPS